MNDLNNKSKKIIKNAIKQYGKISVPYLQMKLKLSYEGAKKVYEAYYKIKL